MEFSRVGQDGHVDGEMIFNLFTVQSVPTVPGIRNDVSCYLLLFVQNVPCAIVQTHNNYKGTKAFI